MSKEIDRMGKMPKPELINNPNPVMEPKQWSVYRFSMDTKIGATQQHHIGTVSAVDLPTANNIAIQRFGTNAFDYVDPQPSTDVRLPKTNLERKDLENEYK